MKIRCQLRRRTAGEVFGKIIGEDGEILDTRFFGKFTEVQFKHLFQVIKKEMSDTTVVDIEFSGN